MLGKIRRITHVKNAQKDTVCEFSGTTINEGDSYWSVVHTPAKIDGAELVFDVEPHDTYKVCEGSFDEFTKAALFVDFAATENKTLEEDILHMEEMMQWFWNKHRDTPSIMEKLNKYRSRITLP